jgi:hypothetical protein
MVQRQRWTHERLQRHCIEYGDDEKLGDSWLAVGDENRRALAGTSLSTCQRFSPGHSPHWIPASRSEAMPHEMGRLVSVEGEVLTVDFGRSVTPYRNHETERLCEIVAIGDEVHVCDRFAILRSGGGDCFSIADIDQPWVSCDHEPFFPTSFVELARRLQTHGGYEVEGSEIRKWQEEDERSNDRPNPETPGTPS